MIQCAALRRCVALGFLGHPLLEHLLPALPSAVTGACAEAAAARPRSRW